MGLEEQRLAQWWRHFEDLRQAGFYGNQAGESEVQEAFDLLERIRTWQRPRREFFMKMGPIPAWLDEATAALVKETVSLFDLAVY